MPLLNVRKGFAMGAVAIALPTALVACATSPETTPESTTSETEAPAETAKALPKAEITDLAEAMGDTITVYGDFEEQIAGTLFLVNEEGLSELEDVFVVNASDRSFSVPADGETPLWVVGQVDRVNAARVDGVEQAALEPFIGEFAVYADRITLAPSPEDISRQAEAFYNEDLTVYGEVEQIDADNTFILQNDALFESGGIVVVQTQDAAAEEVPDEVEVAVSGVLRPYVIADLEEEYGLTWNLDVRERIAADFEEVPVLITDLITSNEEVAPINQ